MNIKNIWKGIYDALKTSLWVVIIVYLLILNVNVDALRTDITHLRQLQDINWSKVRAVVTEFASTLKDVRRMYCDLQSKYDKLIKELSQKVEGIIYQVDYETLKSANVYVVNLSMHWSGSGVIIKRHNKIYILTVAHVIGSLNDIIVVRNSKFSYKVAKIVKVDRKLDLALLKVDFKLEPTYLTIASSANVGETIYVIGNPSGMRDVLTQGIISSKSKNHFLLTATSFYGNSGGAVVNKKGEIVGILQAVLHRMKVKILKPPDELYWYMKPFVYTIDTYYSISSSLTAINKFLEDL